MSDFGAAGLICLGNAARDRAQQSGVFGQFILSMPDVEAANGCFEGCLLLVVEIAQFVEFLAHLVIEPVIQRSDHELAVGAGAQHSHGEEHENGAPLLASEYHDT